MDNNQEQFQVSPEHLNEVLYKRLSHAQNEIINLEALATQLLAEKEELRTQLEQVKSSTES